MDWVENTEDYPDAIVVGMREEFSQEWRRQQTKCGRIRKLGSTTNKNISQENTLDLWRTLKKLKDGEANT